LHLESGPSNPTGPLAKVSAANKVLAISSVSSLFNAGDVIEPAISLKLSGRVGPFVRRASGKQIQHLCDNGRKTVTIQISKEIPQVKFFRMRIFKSLIEVRDQAPAPLAEALAQILFHCVFVRCVRNIALQHRHILELTGSVDTSIFGTVIHQYDVLRPQLQVMTNKRSNVLLDITHQADHDQVVLSHGPKSSVEFLSPYSNFTAISVCQPALVYFA
jgi:hypothetical protein